MIDLRQEQDPNVLRQVALLMEAEIKSLHKRLQQLAREIAALKGGNGVEQLQLELQLVQEQLDRRVDELYGRSSEKRPVTDGSDQPTQDPKPPRKGHGPHEQLALPVVELPPYTLDEPDQVCPKCGGALVPMAGQFEESEEIDVVERSYRIVKHKRQKYTCRCGECVETALGPAKLIPGGRYSLEFAVSVVIDKYLDHLPLDRQVRRMARAGLVVETQTLWDQQWALYCHLLATWQALPAEIRARAVIGADETTWPLLAKLNSRKWWAWSISCADAVYYEIHPTRDRRAAGALLGDYRGVVVSDGWETYGALRRERAREGPTFTLAHCWAHARRKFVECEKHYPAVAGEALQRIRWLYAAERYAQEEARRLHLDEPERLALLAEVRSRFSARLVAELKEWLRAQAVLPRSGAGQAIQYALNLWDGLTLFLDNPLIPLDNNQTERGMRAIAVGRKNHLGSKSTRGMQATALFYSLIESAKMCGLDPAKYLREAARRAINNPGTVTLPHELKKEWDAAEQAQPKP